MSNTNDLSKRTLTLKKTFNAPVETVWEAWTQPGHIANWWAPKGMKTKIVEHDFKVGGKWRYATPMPDGSEFISFGVYSKIVALEKIFSSANFIPMTEGVEIEVFMERDGEKTHFTFNCIHPTEAYRKQQEQMFYNGWNTVFDRLGEFVKALHKK